MHATAVLRMIQTDVESPDFEMPGCESMHVIRRDRTNFRFKPDSLVFVPWEMSSGPVKRPAFSKQIIKQQKLVFEDDFFSIIFTLVHACTGPSVPSRLYGVQQKFSSSKYIKAERTFD